MHRRMVGIKEREMNSNGFMNIQFRNKQGKEQNYWDPENTEPKLILSCENTVIFSVKILKRLYVV